MKPFLSLLIFVVCLIRNLPAEPILPSFSCHEELLKIPLDFKAEFFVRTIHPELVEDSMKDSIMNLHFELIKVRDSYRIRFSSSSEEKRGPPQIFCFDGTDFHFYRGRLGKLQLGDNLVKKQQLINGALQYFPPFIIPWTEAICGAAVKDSSDLTKIYITPEKHYQFILSVEGPPVELISKEYTLRIPKLISYVANYGEGYQKPNEGFSYVVKIGTCTLLQEGEVSPDVFKISDTEVRELATSTPTERKARVFTFPVERTLEAALHKSRTGGLPLFMIYGREECGNCQNLKEIIEKNDLNLTDPAFVIADIDCDDQEGPKFKKAYKIEGKTLPFVVVISPTGELIGSRTGAGELVHFRKLVNDALDRITVKRSE